MYHPGMAQSREEEHPEGKNTEEKVKEEAGVSFGFKTQKSFDKTVLLERGKST